MHTLDSDNIKAFLLIFFLLPDVQSCNRCNSGLKFRHMAF